MALWFWVWPYLFGFVSGALSLLALQSLALLCFLFLLKKKTTDLSASTLQSTSRGLVPRHSVHFLASSKQGVIWVLQPEKLLKEPKKRKDVFDVSPDRKHAKIEDCSLLLTEPDGSHTSIQLKNCVIEAVSATTLASKKWTEKFPIKVESKDSVIYNGNKVFYIFLETSWEKESWCKALRLASCNDKKRLDWLAKLNEDFHNYVTSLNTGYPLFAKPSAGVLAEPVDRAAKSDDSSSKVRQLWKMFSKKTTKTDAESKAGWTSASGREERNIIEKCHPTQDSGPVKTAVVKEHNSSSEENVVIPSSTSSSFAHSRSQSHLSVISDADSEDKLNVDEGTLCLNLLISRLFFDAKSNADTKKVVQAQIQQTLSSMTTPSYIGEVICTDIDFGNAPPHINHMRILPMDINDVWALEVDFEYSGGIVLSIETRLEARELDIIQKGLGDTNSESSAVRDFSPDLLKEIEYYGKELNLSDKTEDDLDQKDEGDLKYDASKDSKASTASSTSRWKSMLQSIVKQVSEVPISLAVRVSSLRGTLCVHIKPPPSDQLWFTFTSMPDINLNLESSVGDHKISNSHIALIIISKLKTAIKEALVHPNYECACIPFMLAEKDDWIPRKAAPFVWVNGEAASEQPTPPMNVSSAKPKTEVGGVTSNANANELPESKHQVLEKKVESVQETLDRPVDPQLPRPTKPLLQSKSVQDLNAPLLVKDKHHKSGRLSGEEIPKSESSSGHLGLPDRSMSFGEDGSKSKRWGRKARMFDIGRKMGEKFEEKRRNIVEKLRSEKRSEASI